MLQFLGVSVSVQQSSSERPIGHKFLFSANRFVKIRNTDVGEMSAACDISSLVARRSRARKSATSFTLPSSVDVFDLPGLWSSFMVTCPSQKRVAQRETVLRSTVCSPQTSRKALCISFMFWHGYVLREDDTTVRCNILHQRTASLSQSQMTSRGRCYARA
jgi:hypothetical protein